MLLLNLVGWRRSNDVDADYPERVAQATQQEGRHRFPWPLRWLNALFRTDRTLFAHVLAIRASIK